MIETIDSSDPNAKFYGQKPWFIKQLPSRIEVLEAANFDLSCRVGRGGSKPWFVKPLPKELEVVWGDTLEAKCQVTDNTSSIISEAKANASEAGTTQEELKAKQSQNTGIKPFWFVQFSKFSPPVKNVTKWEINRLTARTSVNNRSCKKYLV